MRHQMKYCVLVLGLGLAAPGLASESFTPFDYSGVLYGKTKGTATITEAFGINDKGAIVGSFCADLDPAATVPGGCTAPGNAPSHGYVASPKGRKLTFTLINFPGAFETEVVGINNKGTIVGLYDPTMPVPANADTGKGFYCQFPCKNKKDFHSVVYPSSASTDLQAINSAGDMVGVYSLSPTPPFTDYGLLLSGGTFCSIDIGTAITGAMDTNALGINDEKDVVGSYDDPGTGVTGFRLKDVEAPPYVNGLPQPCRYENLWVFTFPVVGVLQTEAAGINNAGVIVGNYLDSAQLSHGFRWSESDGFTTVDFPQTTPGDNAATALNNAKVIVGNFLDTVLNQERAWIRRE